MKKAAYLIMLLLAINIVSAYNYTGIQGILENKSTGVRITGTHEFNASIINSDSSVAYTENQTITTTTNGRWYAFVGQLTSLTYNTFMYATNWSIKIDNEEFTSTPILKVPFSYISDYARYANWSNILGKPDTVNTTTDFGGEVSGTYNNIVIDNNALDDQYYDSEGDLTGLLDNNYVAIGSQLGNTTSEIRQQFTGSDNISISSGVISINGSFSTGAHTVNTNCSVAGSCPSIAYLEYGNTGEFNITGTVWVDGNVSPITSMAHDIGSGTNRWRNLYVTNVSADYVDATYGITTPSITATTMNVTDILHVEIINGSYIYNPYSPGYMDIRADPWYLGGSNLEVAEDLIVGGYIKAGNWTNVTITESQVSDLTHIQNETANVALILSDYIPNNSTANADTNETVTVALILSDYIPNNSTGTDTNETANVALILSDYIPNNSSGAINGTDINLTNITTEGIITRDPWVDVRFYGGIGNGAANETEAFRQAIEYVNNSQYGGTVYIPEGKWEISDSINVPCDVPIRIIGEGRATEIQIVHNLSDAFVMGQVGKNTDYCAMENLYIVGQLESGSLNYTTGTAINTINAKHYIFNNVKVTNGNTGFNITSIGAGGKSVNINLNNVEVTGFEKYGLLIETADGGTNNWNNLIKVSNSWIYSSDNVVTIRRGAATGETSHHMFSNSYIEGSYGDILLNLSNSSNNKFIGTQFDGASNETMIFLDTSSNWNAFIATSFDCEFLDNGTENMFYETGYTETGIHSGSTLHFQRNRSQPIEFWDNVLFDGDTPTPNFLLNRKSTVDGDSALQFYISEYNNVWIKATGVSNLELDAPEGKQLSLAPNGEEDITIFSNPSVDKDPKLLWYVDLDSETDDKYIQYQLKEDTGSFELSRSDKNITDFHVNMPLNVTGTITVGGGLILNDSCISKPSGGKICFE